MSEHDEQKALIKWARARAATVPELNLLFAIPNGGLRNKATAGRLRAEGVLAGVPDLFLPVARVPDHGLFIEMKYGRNHPTPGQLRMIDALKRQQYCVVVCWGWAGAARVIEIYLGIERTVQ